MIGRPRFLDVEDQFENAARFLDAERGCGLVHDNDALGEGGGARHRHALALAARQRLDRLMDVLDRHQAKVVQFLPREFRHASAIGRAEPLSMMPGARGSRPRNMLSAIDKAGERARV